MNPTNVQPDFRFHEPERTLPDRRGAGRIEPLHAPLEQGDEVIFRPL
jgi:hypothetical protein